MNIETTRNLFSFLTIVGIVTTIAECTPIRVIALVISILLTSMAWYYWREERKANDPHRYFDENDHSSLMH